MDGMFNDYPRAGLNPVLAGSRNQAAVYVIQEVAEANKLNPIGLVQPVVGLQGERAVVVPVTEVQGGLSLRPTYGTNGIMQGGGIQSGSTIRLVI